MLNDISVVEHNWTVLHHPEKGFLSWIDEESAVYTLKRADDPDVLDDEVLLRWFLNDYPDHLEGFRLLKMTKEIITKYSYEVIDSNESA